MALIQIFLKQVFVKLTQLNRVHETALPMKIFEKGHQIGMN